MDVEEFKNMYFDPRTGKRVEPFKGAVFDAKTHRQIEQENSILLEGVLNMSPTLVFHSYGRSNRPDDVPRNNSGAWRISGAAKYGRDAYIWVEETRCPSCRERKLSLHTDSSDDEYGPVVLCFGCIEEVFLAEKIKSRESDLSSPASSQR